MARNKKQVKHGDIWRTSRNRFIWIMGLKDDLQDPSASNSVWNGFDLESRVIRQYYGDGTAAWITRTSADYEHLTVIYGKMREPTLIPTDKARQPGTEGIPAIARINRATVQAFTARTVAKAKVKKPIVSAKPVVPGVTPIVDLPPGTPLPAGSGYEVRLPIHWNSHDPARRMTPNPLNIGPGQIVRFRNGQYGRVVSVVDSYWKFHIRTANGDIRTCNQYGMYSMGLITSYFDIVYVFGVGQVPDPRTEQYPVGVRPPVRPRWLVN